MEETKEAKALTTKKELKKTENYEFQYNFSKEELEQKSKQLAKACQDRDAIDDELKMIKAGFKAKIEAKTSEINLLSTHINKGHEYLFKSCFVIYDFEKGVKNYFWNEVLVGTEKMTPHDYQLEVKLSVVEEENEEK